MKSKYLSSCSRLIMQGAFDARGIMCDTPVLLGTSWTLISTELRSPLMLRAKQILVTCSSFPQGNVNKFDLLFALVLSLVLFEFLRGLVLSCCSEEAGVGIPRFFSLWEGQRK